MRVLNSLIVPKKVKRGPWNFFSHPFSEKYQKLEGDPLETLKILRKRKRK